VVDDSAHYREIGEEGDDFHRGPAQTLPSFSSRERRSNERSGLTMYFPTRSALSLVLALTRLWTLVDHWGHRALLKKSLDEIFETDYSSLQMKDSLDRVHIALDFFDGSMNRVGAWVLGTRAVLKSLLAAMLEPRERLLELESSRNNFGWLAMMEELKAMPIGAVWDRYCLEMGVPLLFSRPFQNHGSDDASSLHF
jgi:hypothetical protein